MSKGCEFAKYCKYYHAKSYTCTQAEKDWEKLYCGYYREHFKFKLQEELNKMLGTVDYMIKKELAGK